MSHPSSECSDDIEKTRKRLIFRCWHRGTKEMDILLGSFADAYVPHYEVDKLTLFEELLKENDPDLYNWLTEKENPPANIVSSVYEDLKSHIRTRDINKIRA